MSNNIQSRYYNTTDDILHAIYDKIGDGSNLDSGSGMCVGSGVFNTTEVVIIPPNSEKTFKYDYKIINVRFSEAENNNICYVSHCVTENSVKIFTGETAFIGNMDVTAISQNCSIPSKAGIIVNEIKEENFEKIGEEYFVFLQWSVLNVFNKAITKSVILVASNPTQTTIPIMGICFEMGEGGSIAIDMDTIDENLLTERKTGKQYEINITYINGKAIALQREV